MCLPDAVGWNARSRVLVKASGGVALDDLLLYRESDEFGIRLEAEFSHRAIPRLGTTARRQRAAGAEEPAMARRAATA